MSRLNDQNNLTKNYDKIVDKKNHADVSMVEGKKYYDNIKAGQSPDGSATLTARMKNNADQWWSEMQSDYESLNKSYNRAKGYRELVWGEGSNRQTDATINEWEKQVQHDWNNVEQMEDKIRRNRERLQDGHGTWFGQATHDTTSFGKKLALSAPRNFILFAIKFNMLGMAAQMAATKTNDPARFAKLEAFWEKIGGSKSVLNTNISRGKGKKPLGAKKSSSFEANANYCYVGFDRYWNYSDLENNLEDDMGDNEQSDPKITQDVLLEIGKQAGEAGLSELNSGAQPQFNKAAATAAATALGGVIAVAGAPGATPYAAAITAILVSIFQFVGTKLVKPKGTPADVEEDVKDIPDGEKPKGGAGDGGTFWGLPTPTAYFVYAGLGVGLFVVAILAMGGKKGK